MVIRYTVYVYIKYNDLSRLYVLPIYTTSCTWTMFVCRYRDQPEDRQRINQKQRLRLSARGKYVT